jgi:hypothetical protein
MKNLAISALAAGALATAGIGLGVPAIANAVPSGPTTVDQTVNRLQAQGFQVILNKVGAEPLNQCSVSAIRPGQTFSRTDSGAPGAGNDVITTVTNKTVFVDVKC